MSQASSAAGMANDPHSRERARNPKRHCGAHAALLCPCQTRTAAQVRLSQDITNRRNNGASPRTIDLLASHGTQRTETSLDTLIPLTLETTTGLRPQCRLTRNQTRKSRNTTHSGKTLPLIYLHASIFTHLDGNGNTSLVVRLCLRDTE